MTRTSPTASHKPAFPEPIHVGRPNIGNHESFLTKAKDILDRRMLSNNGPLVHEFEQKISKFLQVRHCICICNATTGLEIATRAAGLRGEVIVPSFTFVATAHALRWQEITPVFADIDPATHNMDPSRIESLITPATSAILATHLWGRPCPVEALQHIANKHGLILMFDAAHAFGCSYRRRPIGGFGLAEVFSFHATKFLNSFEGGAITTNDDALAEKIRLMTNFGFSGYDNVVHLGINGKMTEICAAMGITNFEEIESLVAANRTNFEIYREGLHGIRGLSLIGYDPNETSHFQYIVIEIGNDAARTRNELVEILHAENVLARKYFWPGCHRMEPYKSLNPTPRHPLSETEKLSERVLVLPTGNSLKSEEILTICQILRSALN